MSAAATGTGIYQMFYMYGALTGRCWRAPTMQNLAYVARTFYIDGLSVHERVLLEFLYGFLLPNSF